MSKRKNKVLATVEQTAADTVTVTYAERARRAAPMSPADFKTALDARIDGYKARRFLVPRGTPPTTQSELDGRVKVGSGAVACTPIARTEDGFPVQLRERPKTGAEPVEHPAHYFNEARCKKCHEPIECIDVVQHMSFATGNVVKYAWRAGKKDPSKTLEDLRKARQYIDFEIARVERIAEEARKGGAR